MIRDPTLGAHVLAAHTHVLELEVTETITMDDTGGAAAVLAALDRLGVCIAIDDFGTGYSSLSYLKRLHAHYIKIDQSFVEGLGVNSEDTAIVHAIHGLAKALGLRVVVEGVERPEQLALLRDLKSDLAQGWVFSPAQPAHDVGTLLAEGRFPAAKRLFRDREPVASLNRQLTDDYTRRANSAASRPGHSLWATASRQTTVAHGGSWDEMRTRPEPGSGAPILPSSDGGRHRAGLHGRHAGLHGVDA